MARRTNRRAKDPWAALTDVMAFSLDCQEVIGRRIARLARGDRAAFREAERMVSEKVTAAAMAGMAAWMWPLGVEAATERAAATYRKAVRANRRRLRGG